MTKKTHCLNDFKDDWEQDEKRLIRLEKQDWVRLRKTSEQWTVNSRQWT